MKGARRAAPRVMGSTLKRAYLLRQTKQRNSEVKKKQRLDAHISLDIRIVVLRGKKSPTAPTNGGGFAEAHGLGRLKNGVWDSNRRKDDEYRSWTNGAEFCAAEPGQTGSEACGFCGQEERGDYVLSVGLEPGLHERTCVYGE